jgi:hypothetical protein
MPCGHSGSTTEGKELPCNVSILKPVAWRVSGALFEPGSPLLHQAKDLAAAKSAAYANKLRLSSREW